MKLWKNFFYNVGYQVMIIIVPIILSPYLSRVVGPEGIGTYSYTYSVVTLFSLLANLGVAKYGNREVANCGSDRAARSKVFAELLAIKFCCGITVIAMYLCFVMLFGGEYKTAFYIQTLNLLAYIFEISWLFWGVQEFRVTIAASTVVKILSVFLIFAFVRTKDNVEQYIFILASSACLIQVITWFFVRKYIDWIWFFRRISNKHWKKVFLLFFPVAAKYLYTTMDRIMLGNLVGITEVGYYENVQSITITIVYVLTAMGDVVLPQMTQLYANGERKTREDLTGKVFHLISFCAVGSMYGFIGVAHLFIPLFYGKAFTVCVPLLQYIAPAILFAGYADLIRNIFLLPRYKDKEYVIALFAGCVINFVVNYTLIPAYESVGAIVGTVSAELLVLCVQTWFVRKEMKILWFVKRTVLYCGFGTVILFVCGFVEWLGLKSVIALLADVFVGGVLYTLCVAVYLWIFERKVFNGFRKSKQKEILR